MNICSNFVDRMKRVPRNLSFFCLVCVAVIVFFVAFNHRYGNVKSHFSQPIVRRPSPEIEEMVYQQRLEIEKEMEGFPYEALTGRNVRELSDLAMELGGNPLRSVIVSTLRSGGTLLGDLVSVHPASFYFSEPMFGLDIFKAPLSSSPSPSTILESVFKCNYTNIGDDMEFRKLSYLNDLGNRYLKKQCLWRGGICHEPAFTAKCCRLFPFLVVRIVPSDLASMESFLADKNLGIKMLYLVRDPRGVMSSRKDFDWCKKHPNCNNPATLCSNMAMDYSTAMDFSERYLERFKVLRYEDFVTDPLKLSREIYSFFGLPFHDNVEKFLDTHMNETRGAGYSTFRNAKAVAFQWKEKLMFDEVNDIQENCDVAMNIWGYNFAINNDHQRIFDPLKPLFSINMNHF